MWWINDNGQWMIHCRGWNNPDRFDSIFQNHPHSVQNTKVAIQWWLSVWEFQWERSSRNYNDLSISYKNAKDGNRVILYSSVISWIQTINKWPILCNQHDIYNTRNEGKSAVFVQHGNWIPQKARFLWFHFNAIVITEFWFSMWKKSDKKSCLVSQLHRSFFCGIMSSYWKSLPRYHCTYCNYWCVDNKIVLILESNHL